MISMKIDVKWIGRTLEGVEITAEVFDGIVEFVATWPNHTVGSPRRGKTIEEAIAKFVIGIDAEVGRIFRLTDGVDPNGVFNLTLAESSAYCQDTSDNPPSTEDGAIAAYRKQCLHRSRLTEEQYERAKDLLSARSFHRVYLRYCDKCNFARQHWTQKSPTTCQPDCSSFK